jgi:Cyclic nucleotide-binding domain
LGRIERDLAAAGALPTTTIDALRSCVMSAEPYVRAAALQALVERGAADAETLERLTDDESGLVDEVVDAQRSRAGASEDGVGSEDRLTTIEKMRHLRSIPLFAMLEPTGLAELARASVEATYADGASLGRAGEPGHEAFVLLTGEVRVCRAADGYESVVEIERPGEVFGELAVIDPAPRAATMVAGPDGARVLRLEGAAFRRVLHADPAVAAGVLRTLVRRLRAGQPSAAGPSGG